MIILLKKKRDYEMPKLTFCLGNPFLPFHSILIFHFFQLFKSFKLFHSISFFFNHFFQLFKSLYNIFKSQPFILPQNQQSQTILTSFLQTIFKPFKIIFKPFFPSQKMRWTGLSGLPKQRVMQGEREMRPNDPWGVG